MPCRDRSDVRLVYVLAGMARKQKQREQAALERTIEAGMLQRKGLGKKCKVETKKGKGKTGKAR